MTHRVDYRESVEVTRKEHKTIVSNIEDWATAQDNRRFPYYQRHREQGETEIHVIVTGLPHADIPGVMDDIQTGLDTLPGSWPAPTKHSTSNPE